MAVPERLTVGGRICIVSEFGEAALLLIFGESIDLELNKLVLALALTVREMMIAGVLDVVPAYASMLLQFDPLITTGEELSELLASVHIPESSHIATGHDHVMPVAYGGDVGPDLEGLAARHHLTESEVVKLHSAAEYRVFFIGFMPGFAYMGPVAQEIATPRLAVPRLNVARGSVGIAGNQTGIYPFSSPGGWNIIGRTAVSLWNSLNDPPTLLSPGDRVRFAETRDTGFLEQVSRSPEQDNPRRPVFSVVEPGGSTTIQDLGRPGFGMYGVPRGGALDRASVMSANRLVGNEPGGPVLEITGGGLELQVLQTTVIALSGAGADCFVEGLRVPPGLSWLVRAGHRITFNHRPGGGTTYLALAGGFDVPTELGSASTLVQAGLGGYRGRALRVGDVLGAAGDRRTVAELAGRTYHSNETSDTLPLPLRIRLIPFACPNAAPDGALAGFLATEWLVSAHSNRMGMRLESPNGQLLPASGGELLSFGVVRGAVQLPPGGSPIILGPDHGTTGGYPILGVVPQADWPLLARLAPGAPIRFALTTASESAQEIRR